MGLIKKLFKKITKNATAKAKGSKGERQVSAKLNPLIFGRVEHRQINNLMLVDETGKSHQIDHIEIRHNGIFCIETKNYSGWIFGEENQRTWTQTLYNEKHQFPNPIKQNLSHIYHLNKALDGKYKINSVIVFVQNNADRIDVPYVINLKDLKEYLLKFNDGTQYSTADMDIIYQKLKDAARKDVSTREHVATIKKTQQQIQRNICPRCGGALVVRKGRNGEFYGCQSYPKCTFTKPI